MWCLLHIGRLRFVQKIQKLELSLSRAIILSSEACGIVLEKYLYHVADAPMDLAHHPVIPAGDFHVCLPVQATRSRRGGGGLR